MVIYMNDKTNTDKLINITQGINQEQVEGYISSLLAAQKVFFVAAGNLVLVLESHVEKLRSSGIDAYLVGAVNEPGINDKDILVVACEPGESLFPRQITAMARGYGAKVAYLAHNPENQLAQLADAIVDLHPIQQERESTGLTTQDLSPLFEHQVRIFGEAVCSQIAEIKNSARNNMHISGH